MNPRVNNIFNNNNFPCFVKNGEDIEDPNTAPNLKEKYARIARNGLRHLTRGTSLTECKLITWSNFKTIFIDNDKDIFKAARQEMQNVFLNIYTCISNGHLDPQAEHRAGIFINNLLAVFPLLEPDESEIFLPQKIKNNWELVKYRIKKIDISPQSGLLSKLIEDEDRLYAYGLQPINNSSAQPYLLFEGTTHRPLNLLYNFLPNTSVGEGHDMTLVIRFIKQQLHLKVVGLSKGGTVTEIIAKKYSAWISEAECLNPTGLNPNTIMRLNIDDTRPRKKNKINIYTQEGDPVFLIENCFLEDAHIYTIKVPNKKTGKLESHVHCFSGRQSSEINEMLHPEQEIPSRTRTLISDLKEALNWIIFPILYVRFCFQLCMRKIERFCSQHAKMLYGALFVAGMITCAALFASGVGAPAAASMMALMSPPMAYAALALGSVAASAVTSFILPKITKFAVKASAIITFATVAVAGIVAALSIGTLISGIKIGIQSLFQRKPHPTAVNGQAAALSQDSSPAPTNNDSTKLSLNKLKRVQSDPNICAEYAKEEAPIENTQLKRCNSEPNLSKWTFLYKGNQEEDAFTSASNEPLNREISLSAKKIM